MTRWHWFSILDLALSLATVTMVTTLCLTTVAMGCPEPCQCTQTYYVYCQKIGLTSENVLEVVTSVPYEALLLDLSSNALDRLAPGVLDSVPNLEYLFLAHNQLHTVGLSVFHYQQRLRELSLRENQLKEVGGGVFVNMSSLTKLHLDGNDIERIHVHAFALPQLRQLYLQQNRLTRLAPWQLSGLTALQVLDLSDNQIQTVEVGAFQDLSSVQVLHLSGNRLSSLAKNVFQGLTSLRELYLDANLLQALDCFEVPHFASSLQTLVLSNNSLVAVPQDVVSKLRSLRVLTLDHNHISFVGRQAFKDLLLDNLTLAHNFLETIDREMLEGSRRISKLDLSHNRIQTIRTGAFDSFRESVYVLNLAGNKLTTLDHGMLRGMRNLQTLNFSSNALRSILEGSFEELVQLTDLDLDHNELQRLSADLLRGPSLQRLSALDNPLRDLRGFTFEDAQQPVHVWVNLTLQSSSMRSVTVTWPYREGAQLYWTLRFWCSGPTPSHSSCQAPLIQSSVSPNKLSETVEGLQPGTEYFVCVDPVFLKKFIHVSQCGRVSTLRNSPTTLKPQDHRNTSTNHGFSARGECGLVCFCLLLALWTTVHVDLWRTFRTLISDSWTKSSPLVESGSVPCVTVR